MRRHCARLSHSTGSRGACATACSRCGRALVGSFARSACSPSAFSTRGSAGARARASAMSRAASLPRPDSPGPDQPTRAAGKFDCCLPRPPCWRPYCLHPSIVAMRGGQSSTLPQLSCIRCEMRAPCRAHQKRRRAEARLRIDLRRPGSEVHGEVGEQIPAAPILGLRVGIAALKHRRAVERLDDRRIFVEHVVDAEA